MNTHSNTAASLLLIGLADKADNADDAAQAAIERRRKLALRCIEVFGGSPLSADATQIVATFNSANTGCRAAIAIREKTAALLPTNGVTPDIRIACIQAQKYLDGETGEALANTLVPIVTALMASDDAGHMRIDVDTLSALSPDLQRHFQVALEGSDNLLPADRLFYRYQPVGSDEEEASTDIAVPVVGKMPVNDIKHRAQQAQSHLPRHSRKPRSAPEAPRPSGQARLYLYHAGAHFVLDGDKPAFTIGRDRGCHLPIAGANTSRLHAWIHTDGRHFILCDQSTNGIFIKMGNAPEIYLHHQEIILHDKGIIGIAGSTQDATIPQIEFQVS